ncbi:type III pantothenate kinase [Thiobacter aerophilum]|uniref:Type III pantothenate kinase n=1 Tax=Thiobacter aerophilum TaxID=3121275 RepID=A0ABV0EFR2_9BURK
MLLAIDAGNSFVKLGWHEGEVWREVARIPLEDFAAFAAAWSRPVPARIVIADVAGERFRPAMERLVAAWGRPVLWVRAKAASCGVTNGYRQPEQLGVDRWCALVAARQMGPGAKLVVSVGTAVTVDALSHTGVFQGGVILPGVALMKRALAAHTAGLAEARGAYQPFPRDTGSAMHTGALLAIAGTVDRMTALLAAQDAPLEILLTGGDGAAIEPLLTGVVRYVPNLVLEGLLCIAREEGFL